MEDYKIDFVIPWVDGSDPDWAAEKQKYWQAAGHWPDGNAASRFRDWDNLRYWFRGAEKFAPWVNHIYFVTCGQIPDWLNCSHPKLTVVDHRDFIPEKYLPVFSANPIELNLHRIPGLSEHFVYFNDDVFLTGPVTGEDFFRKGLPREMAAEYPLTNSENNDSFAHMLLTMNGLINSSFRKRDCMRKHPGKWFSPRYGRFLFNNLLMLPYPAVSGLVIPHLAAPMRKSTMEKVWDRWEDRLWETTAHRFRDPSDLTQYLFRYWEIMSGTFAPANPFKSGRELFLLSDDPSEAVAVLNSRKYRMVCLNDSSAIRDFEQVKYRINSCLRELLPEKSAFEN